MAENFYTILTAVGKSKLANSAVLGNKVNLKTLQAGDGSGIYHEPSENQTSLVNKVWEGEISSISVDETNSNWIVMQTIIPATDGGFFIREAGIFDEDGDLIAVSKISETYKPVISEGSSKDVCIKIVMEVSNVDNITLKIDSNIVVATKNDIEVLESKIENINTQLAEKANDTDNSRTTISKTVTGAINELNSEKASLVSPAFTGTPTAPTQVTTDNSTKIATTAFINNLLMSIGSTIVFNNDSTYAFRGVKGIMADSDFWRIGGGATASDFGYMEIATADNGSEPIHVRQYTGEWTSLIRTLTLLDASGNTLIPGTVIAGGNVQSSKFLAAESSTTGGGYSFTVDGAQDTGMFSSGDGIINFYSNGVNAMTIKDGGGCTIGSDYIVRAKNAGCIIQSGMASFSSQYFGTGTLYTLHINYPSAFTDTPKVLVTPTFGNSGYGPVITAENITSTGFDLKVGYASSTTSTPAFNWIALGN